MPEAQAAFGNKSSQFHEHSLTGDACSRSAMARGLFFFPPGGYCARRNDNRTRNLILYG